VKPIQDIRPVKPSVRKIRVIEEKSDPLDKHSFTVKINELSKRLNYSKEELSRKERFLRAVHRYNHFSK
jgi:hypothetical protein